MLDASCLLEQLESDANASIAPVPTRFNKGTAFTEGERRALGLEGLLLPSVTTIELVARCHAEIAALDHDLQKYLVLTYLQARNETLYYAVLMSDPAT
jgi:malate dehydrogenase (oxaloacetate-decarboxylating)(NADP+)